MLNWLAHLPRTAKRLVTAAADSVISVFSLWAALSLRLEQWVPLDGRWWPLFVAAPLTAIPVFIRTGLYRAVVRHFSLEAIGTVALAVTLAIALWGVAALFLDIRELPRSVILIVWFIFFTLTLGSRVVMHRLLLARPAQLAQTPVAIYGAGDEGAQLARMLMASDTGYRPEFFVDENDDLQGGEIAGLRVVAPDELARLAGRIEEVLVTAFADDAGGDERLRVLNFLGTHPVRTKVLPPMKEWVAGRVNLDRIHRVEIEDLLGREPVPPDRALLEAGVRGRCVLVTGAGGSIGSQLCEQLLALEAGRLLLVEQSEYALFAVQQRLAALAAPDAPRAATDIVPLLGSVEDAGFIAEVFDAWPVDTVYHAAAYKHVPIVEGNLIAGVRNNVLGTRVVAEAAKAASAGRFVLISTDKAVRPASVMGASKRLAEMLLQSLAGLGGGTCFSMVRFGNVLGSSGSVIPLFRGQIDRREAVTVTHPDAERYFMTLREAAELVIQAGMLANSGDVLLLDMGKPVKIAEVARKMIYLSGLRASGRDNEQSDIEIRYTGLRPGEKLREELLTGGAAATSHPKIMRALEPCPDWPRMEAVLQSVERAIEARDAPGLRRLLAREVPSYGGGEVLNDLLSRARGGDGGR